MSSSEIIRPETQELLNQPNPSMRQILAHAVLSGRLDVEVVERLAKLEREEVTYAAMIEFNDAMHRCQERIKPIVAKAKSDKGKYADLAQVDNELRPIYTSEGFSLSFSDGDPIGPGWLRIICYVSRSGYTRMYQKDMPLVTTGAKGGEVMTAIHAQGSSDTYAKRYLTCDIFNVAITKNDNDGSTAPKMGDSFFEWRDALKDAGDKDSFSRTYRDAFKAAEAVSDWKAIDVFKEIKTNRKKEWEA